MNTFYPVQKRRFKHLPLFLFLIIFLIISVGGVSAATYNMTFPQGTIGNGNGYFDNEKAVFNMSVNRDIFAITTGVGIYLVEPIGYAAGTSTAHELISGTDLKYATVASDGYLYYTDSSGIVRKLLRNSDTTTSSTDTNPDFGTSIIVDNDTGAYKLFEYDHNLYYQQGNLIKALNLYTYGTSDVFTIHQSSGYLAIKPPYPDFVVGNRNGKLTLWYIYSVVNGVGNDFYSYVNVKDLTSEYTIISTYAGGPGEPNPVYGRVYGSMILTSHDVNVLYHFDENTLWGPYNPADFAYNISRVDNGASSNYYWNSYISPYGMYQGYTAQRVLQTTSANSYMLKDGSLIVNQPPFTYRSPPVITLPSVTITPDYNSYLYYETANINLSWSDYDPSEVYTLHMEDINNPLNDYVVDSNNGNKSTATMFMAQTIPGGYYSFYEADNTGRVLNNVSGVIAVGDISGLPAPNTQVSITIPNTTMEYYQTPVISLNWINLNSSRTYSLHLKNANNASEDYVIQTNNGGVTALFFYVGTNYPPGWYNFYEVDNTGYTLSEPSLTFSIGGAGGEPTPTATATATATGTPTPDTTVTIQTDKSVYGFGDTIPYAIQWNNYDSSITFGLELKNLEYGQTWLIAPYNGNVAAGNFTAEGYYYDGNYTLNEVLYDGTLVPSPSNVFQISSSPVPGGTDNITTTKTHYINENAIITGSSNGMGRVIITPTDNQFNILFNYPVAGTFHLTSILGTGDYTALLQHQYGANWGTATAVQFSVYYNPSGGLSIQILDPDGDNNKFTTLGKHLTITYTNVTSSDIILISSPNNPNYLTWSFNQYPYSHSFNIPLTDTFIGRWTATITNSSNSSNSATDYINVGKVGKFGGGGVLSNQSGNLSVILDNPSACIPLSGVLSFSVTNISQYYITIYSQSKQYYSGNFSTASGTIHFTLNEPGNYYFTLSNSQNVIMAQQNINVQNYCFAGTSGGGAGGITSSVPNAINFISGSGFMMIIIFIALTGIGVTYAGAAGLILGLLVSIPIMYLLPGSYDGHAIPVWLIFLFSTIVFLGLATYGAKQVGGS